MRKSSGYSRLAVWPNTSLETDTDTFPVNSDSRCFYSIIGNSPVAFLDAPIGRWSMNCIYINQNRY